MHSICNLIISGQYQQNFSLEKKLEVEVVSTLIANESADDLDDKDSKDELHISKTEEEIIEERSEEKGVNIRKRKKMEKSKRTVN